MCHRKSTGKFYQIIAKTSEQAREMTDNFDREKKELVIVDVGETEETKFAVKTIEHESEVKKISKMFDMLENLSIINGYGDLIHDDIQILIEGKNNAKETYDNIR